MAKSVLKGLDTFELSAEKLFQILAQYRAEVGRKVLTKYAATAGRYAPPNMGKAKIDEHFYKRRIYYLPELVESGKRTKWSALDLKKLHEGFLFKVIVRPRGSGLDRKADTPLYFRTKAEAQQHQRILTRGYLKLSFSVGLMPWGAKPASWVKGLIGQSPALAGMTNQQQVLLADEDDVLRGVMKNFVMPAHTNFAKIASQRAEKAVGKMLEKEIKKLDDFDWNL